MNVKWILLVVGFIGMIWLLKEVFTRYALLDIVMWVFVIIAILCLFGFIIYLRSEDTHHG